MNNSTAQKVDNVNNLIANFTEPYNRLIVHNTAWSHLNFEILENSGKYIGHSYISDLFYSDTPNTKLILGNYQLTYVDTDNWIFINSLALIPRYHVLKDSLDYKLNLVVTSDIEPKLNNFLTC